MRYFKLAILGLGLFISGCGLTSDDGSWFGGWSLFDGTPDYVMVEKGDTLYSISRKYNVPLREVVEANGLRPPYNLRIGQTIRLPNARFHEVAKGDTLYSISKRYNVDVSSLSRTNGIQPPYNLSIGQRLLLPGSVVDKQPTAIAQSTKPVTVSKTSSSSSTKSATIANAAVSAPAPTTYRKTKFGWPVKGTILSKYGTIGKGRNNDGINIKSALGAPIKAADKGTIAYAGNELKGFGNLILIKHDDGWITAYAHNDKILVKKGQRVTKGEKIANAGSTGGVNSPQCHFEVRSGKKALNPMSYLE